METFCLEIISAISPGSFAEVVKPAENANPNS